MKMCDQVIALISPKHADKIVWSGEETGLKDANDDDESDRLFNFEVAKTNEQEETVTTRPGFQVCLLAFSPFICLQFATDDFPKYCSP
jgi:hypothetical protein